MTKLLLYQNYKQEDGENITSVTNRAISVTHSAPSVDLYCRSPYPISAEMQGSLTQKTPSLKSDFLLTEPALNSFEILNESL